MKKDEMISVLSIAGADSRTIDAMAEAYDMGLEYGAKGYTHLTGAIEAARNVCLHVNLGQIDEAQEDTGLFWEHVNKLKDME